MYQGENAKYNIDLFDENGGPINPSSIEEIHVLIYNERTRSIKIERTFGVDANSNITISSGSFKFVIDRSDTLNLTPGRYRINIEIVVSDLDFDDDRFYNIEDAPLFELKANIKKD